jgi:L-fuconolactonase
MTVARIDSHQHFWRLSRGDYDWMSPKLKAIYRDFEPNDLEPYLKSHQVSKTVAVQAAATVAETEYLLKPTKKNDWIVGVVGWVNMTSPDAIATLDRLKANPKLVGIRPMIQDIADPDWMLSPELTPVFRWLEKNRLAFDALVRPEHLKNLARLLDRHDDLNAVIDHGGKPNIRERQFDAWAEDIAYLANNTRACCKLSGLLTEASIDAGYHELSPYIDWLLKCFGPGKLIWGSDWPVLNLAADYSRWVVLCEQALAPLPAADQRKIWRDNAIAFYNLAI